MLSRFGPVALVLSIFTLLSIPADAQLQIRSAQESVSYQNATPLLQDVVTLSLHVIHDSRLERRTFTPEQLAGMTEIIVDGYVNGVVVLTTTPLILTVDHRPMNTIHVQGDGSHKLKYYGVMAPQRFWAAYLPEGDEGLAHERIKGRYSSFSRIPWDTLSLNQTFEINIDRNGVQQVWTIRQDTPVKLDAFAPPKVESPASSFYYLGKDLGRFKQKSTDFNERLAAIQAGIRGVEAIASGAIVEQVHILDCQGPGNAYTSPNKAELWINGEMFWNESLPELRVIAEHEAMHILADRLELPTNPRIRALFADLAGFDTSSREQALIMATGYPSAPLTARAVPAKSSILFDFINESNFIRGMNGGHSQESVDEFCASFLHTLFYIDRLGLLLGQPVITRRGAVVVLSTAEQAQLLEAYHRVAAAMDQEVRQLVLPEPVTALFRSGLATTHQVGIPFEVHCVEAAVGHARQPS